MAAGEMETIVRLGLPVTLVVISNGVYGWIKAGQKSGFGERYYSVDFSRTDHARVAEAFGLKAWRVEDPADLERSLRAAVEHGGPTLVDIVTQPLQAARAPVSERSEEHTSELQSLIRISYAVFCLKQIKISHV